MEWTDKAKQALHDYVGKTTGQPATSDTYQDLFSDLTAHVEEEVHQSGNTTIHENAVLTVLGKVGGDEFEDEVIGSSAVNIGQQNTGSLEANLNTNNILKLQSASKIFWATLFTIILPVIALGVELATGASKFGIFDPIPTWIHVVLIALVPITFILYSCLKASLVKDQKVTDDKLKHYKVITALMGFIFPAILYYTLLFLPTTPFAIIGCLFLMGFLPLAPIVCLIGWFCALSALNMLSRHFIELRKVSFLKWGMLAGFLSLLVLEVPSYLRQDAVTDAMSSDLEVQEKGIEKVLRYGGEEEILSYSYYGNPRGGMNSRGSGKTAAYWVSNGFKSKRIDPKIAREVYYRITGEPFNAIKPPEAQRGYTEFNEFDWDHDHGGDIVAGQTAGLELHSSRMDMHIDDASKLGYLEWIIEFKNDNRTAKEARMQVALPHNAFVSKLTLWVNGEECPASFNTVGKVKAAYKKIAVQQRRDPVLVNVSGADRVMLQCFPVPSDGGIMKMKVGITIPLDLIDSEASKTYLPYIAVRNFGISENLKHELFAQSDLVLSSADSSKQKVGTFSAIQMSIDNQDLKSQRIDCVDMTPTDHTVIWTVDPFHAGDDKYLERRDHMTLPEITGGDVANKVIVVIDSSASLQKWKPMIAKSMGDKTANVDFYVVGGRDEKLRKCNTVEEFEEIEFKGGVDNVPALREALRIAKTYQGRSSSILWLHGSQPVDFSTVPGLEQDLERSLISVPVYNVALEDGANYILKALKNNTHFRGGYRVVDAGDLVEVIGKIETPMGESKHVWVRGPSEPEGGQKVWDQIAREWAFESTQVAVTGRKSTKADKGIPVAARYQIVSPLSGAVVLESNAQYLETGLEIPDWENSAEIPVVPEPSSSLLVLMGVIIVSLRRKRGE